MLDLVLQALMTHPFPDGAPFLLLVDISHIWALTTCFLYTRYTKERGWGSVLIGGRGVLTSCIAVVVRPYSRPSHSYNAGPGRVSPKFEADDFSVGSNYSEGCALRPH